MASEFRRVQEVGGRLSVNLPKRAAERAGFKKGQLVEFAELHGGAFVLRRTE